MKNRILIFDIETAPIDWELFSDSQKEYWLRYAKTEEEIQDKMFQRSLTPFTGKVLCIGLMVYDFVNDDWEIVKQGVLATNPDSDDTEVHEMLIVNDVKMQLSTEKKVLEDFWKILKYYDFPTIITFNGRNFDAPFLMLRSAIYKIRPTINLMSGTKFNYYNHIDLIDELTYYSSGFMGATKRFNFDFYAQSFGIVSPKAQGVDGSKVPTLFAEGKIVEISEYCMRDVVATFELFQHWRTYLNFQ